MGSLDSAAGHLGKGRACSSARDEALTPLETPEVPKVQRPAPPREASGPQRQLQEDSVTRHWTERNPVRGPLKRMKDLSFLTLLRGPLEVPVNSQENCWQPEKTDFLPGEMSTLLTVVSR